MPKDRAFPRPGRHGERREYKPGTKRGEDSQGRKIMQHSRAETARGWERSKRRAEKERPYRASKLPLARRNQSKIGAIPRFPYKGYGGDTTRHA